MHSLAKTSLIAQKSKMCVTPIHSGACRAKHQTPQSRVKIKDVDVNASEAVQDAQRGEEGARGRRLETGGVVRVQQLLSHMIVRNAVDKMCWKARG